MILVGEVRDVETARIAVQSALTGHFVLSSLHATDAVVGAAPVARHGHRDVPGRVVGDSPWSPSGWCAASAATAATPYHPHRRGAGVLRQHRRRRPKDGFFRGDGCNFCARTGYLDRIGVYEMMRITDAIRS